MKHRNVIEGVRIEIDDGDEETDDITELHGVLAEEADNELVDSAYKVLIDRGYKVTIPKGAYQPKRRKSNG